MNTYISNLSALRGIAALLVVIMHFDLMYGAIIPNYLNSIMNRLYLMVDLFFILSGFVMCHVYQDMFTKKMTIENYKKFLFLRLARVYPLHLTTLFITICLYGVLSYSNTFSALNPIMQYMYQPSAVPMHLLFLDTFGFYDFVTWNSPAWSLSAEWWAYVCFPFILMFSVKYKYSSRILLPIFVVCSWLLLEFYLAGTQPFVHFPPDPNKQNLNLIWHWGALRGIAGFVAGMIMYRVYKKKFLKKMLSRTGLLTVLTIAIISNMSLGLWDTLTVMIMCLVVLTAAYGSTYRNRTLQYKPLQKLGDWSFSIYLWHLVVLNVYEGIFIVQGESHKEAFGSFFNGQNMFGSQIVLLGYMCVVLIIARYSFEYLEKPSRQFLRKRISD